MSTGLRTYRNRTAGARGSVLLALLLVVGSVTAADLHRLVFHGQRTAAANARVGRFCASHGETPPPGQRDVSLRDGQTGTACPICASHFLWNDSFLALIGGGAKITFANQPLRLIYSESPAFAHVCLARSRAPPIS